MTLLNEMGWEALASIRLRRLEEVNAENERLRAAHDHLRYGLEEICRGTDPRAGNGHMWEFGVAMRALRDAGIPDGAAGIQKPMPLDDEQSKEPTP